MIRSAVFFLGFIAHHCLLKMLKDLSYLSIFVIIVTGASSQINFISAWYNEKMVHYPFINVVFLPMTRSSSMTHNRSVCCSHSIVFLSFLSVDRLWLQQVSGLKSVTAKHLSLASQTISLFHALIPGQMVILFNSM
jgi:hypothetical protein